ncbi:MAG: hypothetical protein COV70_03845 [Parcubacteria group bacterium CG11_big_fil_rev_8_21_14_0_20_39_22]|nr:MAG: hypothetical protein COV70_03845 [Parcubacteria group bacterium CG11_big_fil_rev_8_21_14_0_20_39_22]
MGLEIFLILVAGIVFGIWAGRRVKGGAVLRVKEKSIIEKQAREKSANLEKVIRLFDTKKEVRNNDVEKEIKVSDATATRYLSELESSGKIKQVGDVGQGVYYVLK